MKIHNNKIKEKDYIINRMISVTIMVQSQVTQRLIEGVINNKGDVVDLEETDANDQIIHFRIVGKKKKQRYLSKY